MNKKEKITDDTFKFIKYTCRYCGKKINTNEIFCSIKCKVLYFEKQQKIRNGTYISKKTQNKRKVYSLSDILDKEQLKEMIRKSKNKIKRDMRKRN